MTDDPDTAELENRIDNLESKIEKMMPSRRDALKMGGAALVGGAAMSGTASAGTNQVGTIGSASQPVDLESEDINNADTITTQDIVVNGTATGPFGAGAPVIEAGDTITVASISNKLGGEFHTVYNGSAKDVVAGNCYAAFSNNFLYTFSDSTTLKFRGTGTFFEIGENAFGHDRSDAGDNFSGQYQVTVLPPAKDVTKIEVGTSDFGEAKIGAEVILKG